MLSSDNKKNTNVNNKLFELWYFAVQWIQWSTMYNEYIVVTSHGSWKMLVILYWHWLIHLEYSSSIYTISATHRAFVELTSVFSRNKANQKSVNAVFAICFVFTIHLYIVHSISNGVWSCSGNYKHASGKRNIILIYIYLSCLLPETMSVIRSPKLFVCDRPASKLGCGHDLCNNERRALIRWTSVLDWSNSTNKLYVYNMCNNGSLTIDWLFSGPNSIDFCTCIQCP